YPHSVVNHLSLEEARHRYGGVVSVLPIVLDSMREWVTHSKRKLLYIVSPGCSVCKKETPTSQTAPAGDFAALTSNSNKSAVQLQEKDFQKFRAANQRPKKK
ncbi:SACA9 protein, partial [Peucedramus taeniatus]|nr:SACA9 protein [Peucedramus taeniatus]